MCAETNHADQHELLQHDLYKTKSITASAEEARRAVFSDQVQRYHRQLVSHSRAEALAEALTSNAQLCVNVSATLQELRVLAHLPAALDNRSEHSETFLEF